jgi:hypothetical protein
MSDSFKVSDYFRILWTAVPDGIDATDRMRVRILVQPRLFDTPDAGDRDKVEYAVKACFSDWPTVVENLVKQVGNKLAVTFYKVASDGTCAPVDFGTAEPPWLSIALPAKPKGTEPSQPWNPDSWRTVVWQKMVQGVYLNHTEDPWINWPSASATPLSGRTAGASTTTLRSPTFTRSYPAHHISRSLRQINTNQLGRVFSPSVDTSTGNVRELEDDLLNVRWGSTDGQAKAAAEGAVKKEKAYLASKKNGGRERHDADGPTPLYDPKLVNSHLYAIGRAQQGIGSTAQVPSADPLKKGLHEHIGRLQHRDVHRVAPHAPQSALSPGAHQRTQLLSNGLYSQHEPVDPSTSAGRNPQMSHFLAVSAFHGRAGRPKRSSQIAAMARNGAPPSHDFFDKISLLQNYPNLLPELGLVLIGHVDGLIPEALGRYVGGGSDGAVGAVGVAPVQTNTKQNPGLALDSIDPILSIASATGFNLGKGNTEFRLVDRHDLYPQGMQQRDDDDPNDPALRMVSWIKAGTLDFTARIDPRAGTPSPNSNTDDSKGILKLQMECLDYDGGAVKLVNFAHSQQRANAPKIVTSTVPPKGAAGTSNFWILGANSKALKLFNLGGIDPKSPISLDSYLLDKTAAWATLQRYLTCPLAGSLTTDWKAHRIVENLDITIHPKTTDDNGNPNPPVTKVSIRVHRGFNQTPKDPLSGQILVWYLYSNDNPPPEQHENTPSHRSARVSLVTAARDSEVARAKFNSDRLEGDWRSNTKQSPTSPAPVLLDSADLVLGLAPYIRDSKTANWVSMSQRRELFDWGGDQSAYNLAFDGVASVRLGTTTTGDSPSNESSSNSGSTKKTADNHAAPRLFKWNGPTLSVPPTAADVTMHGKDNDEPQVPQPTGRIVPVTLSVLDNSEPPLRFSTVDSNGNPNPLEFQVRVMNRAGGPTDGFHRSYPETLKPDPTSIGSCYHLRYEPIPAPVVLLDQPFKKTSSPQKGLQRLVLDTADSDKRWLAPPRGDVDLCWTHGQFDVPDEASFNAIGSFRAIKLSDEGNFRVVHVREAPPDDKTVATAPLYQKGSFEANREFPYYPDPMARRLAFRVEDFRGHVISTHLTGASLDWYPQREPWPHARAMRVELKHADDGKTEMQVEWQPTKGRLIVWLPPGWRATVKLMCVPDTDKASSFGLGVLGLYQDFLSDPQAVVELMASINSISVGTRQTSASSVTDFIRGATLAGENPTISPALELEMVYPVKKPLKQPKFNDNTTLQQGQGLPLNAAVLDGTVEVDAKSTGQVDYIARWYDWTDDPTKSDRPSVGPDAAKRNPSLGEAMLQNLTIPSKKWLTLEPNPGMTSVSVDPSNGQHSFPDTRHRFVEYTARAHSSFRAFYDTSAIKDTNAFIDESKTIWKEFKNTVPPPPPAVAYGVPSFAWTSGKDPTDYRKYQSERRGGNIRLWLNRGWLATGEGELLGILCLQPSSASQIKNPDAQGKFFSRWGSDPTRPNANVQASYGPTLTDFLGATTYANIQALDDNGQLITLGPNTASGLDLVTYAPQYDLGRRLWYCDIQFKTIPSNYAFVKLALVRYQPASLAAPQGSPDTGISTITLADFAQLYPNRAISVVRAARRRLEVGVFGHLLFSNSDLTTAPDCGTFQIRVERYSHGREPPQDAPHDSVQYKQQKPDPSTGEVAHFTIEFPEKALHHYAVTVIEGEWLTGDKTKIPQRIVYADVIDLAQTGVL